MLTARYRYSYSSSYGSTRVGRAPPGLAPHCRIAMQSPAFDQCTALSGSSQ
jgi:hypothetical protein